MKLYLISQTENDGFDTFDSAVVAAESEEAARMMVPTTVIVRRTGLTRSIATFESAEDGAWCSGPEKVTVKYIGEAADGVVGLVVASFNAG